MGKQTREQALNEALSRILRAHKSGNNGAVMGEATLCRYFEGMAEAALALPPDPVREAAPEMLVELRAIVGWASDEGPLAGKSPMDVAEHARAALSAAEKERGA